MHIYPYCSKLLCWEIRKEKAVIVFSWKLFECTAISARQLRSHWLPLWDDEIVLHRTCPSLPCDFQLRRKSKVSQCHGHNLKGSDKLPAAYKSGKTNHLSVCADCSLSKEIVSHTYSLTILFFIAWMLSFVNSVFNLFLTLGQTYFRIFIDIECKSILWEWNTWEVH